MSVVLPSVYRYRLVATYRGILRDPECWNQRVWAERTPCGTVGCFAGNAASAAGWLPAFGGLDGPGNEVTSWAVSADGRARRISSIAREWLGLSEVDADALFQHENTLQDLRELIFDLAGVDPDTADLDELREATS